MAFVSRYRSLALLLGMSIALIALAGRVNGRLTVSAQLAPTPTFAPNPITLSITGQATLGTAGSTLPTGLQATLHLLRGQAGKPPALIGQRQSAIDGQATYRFLNVTAQPGDLVFVSVNYEGIQQSSVIVELPNDARDFDLPITLYAPTDDPAAITLVRARHVLNVQSAGVIQVLASYFFRNTSDRYYLSNEQAANRQRISARVPLPIGAQEIALDRGLIGRAAIGGSPIAPIVQDLRPVLPGQVHELVFSYLLPFERGLSIDQDFPYGAETVEIVFPQDSSITFAGEGREYEVSTNTTINPQRPYVQYALKTPLRAGERLIYTLSVTLNAASRRGERSPTTETSLFPLVVLALTVIGLVATAVAFVRRIGRGGKSV